MREVLDSLPFGAHVLNGWARKMFFIVFTLI